MTVLLGIISLHLLIIVRAKMAVRGGTPYVSIFLLSAAIVVYVVFMSVTMQPPEF